MERLLHANKKCYKTNEYEINSHQVSLLECRSKSENKFGNIFMFWH